MLIINFFRQPSSFPLCQVLDLHEGHGLETQEKSPIAELILKILYAIIVLLYHEPHPKKNLIFQLKKLPIIDAFLQYLQLFFFKNQSK